MKNTTIQLDSKLPGTARIGKTVFRVSRTYQSGRSAVAAYSSHIHKKINPTEAHL